MANVYSGTPGVEIPSSRVSINDNRRLFNFGERVAELAPEQSPFFVYLSKVAKKPTNDPVFKFLEQRHQWQRRNFTVKTAIAAYDPDPAQTGSKTFVVHVGYDKYGKSVDTKTQANFFVADGKQLILVKDKDGKMVTLKVTANNVDNAAQNSLACQVQSVDGSTVASSYPNTIEFEAEAPGMVIGSAFAEGTGAPSGWRDELSDSEGYCQIFKTAIDLFSGTSLATSYRGYSDEYRRVWREKLMEHKMDIEHAMLYGVGKSDESGAGPVRYTHGIIPYIKANGGKSADFTAASSNYDNFIDYMEDFFAPEKGNSGDKLVLASRPVIGWMNKLGTSSFWENTGGTSSYSLDIAQIPGSYGHNVTKINTAFGNLHVVQEPLLRGAYSGHMVMIDLKNVAYRPLAGNGKNRDTQIMTNIQDNDMDGRKDMILTEAGLEISLPETHGLINFTDL
ncbi:MAG: Uncharacterised protein [Chloroflexota bacterium]|nr:MAG: Uncharacterised protein [Chloroflexota bacterium]